LVIALTFHGAAAETEIPSVYRDWQSGPFI